MSYDELNLLNELPFIQDNVVWTYEKENNYMFKYKNSPIKFLGEGGYGAVYKINRTDIVVKYMIYDGKSDRLDWKNQHENIETTDEMQEQAFLEDVKYESMTQNEVSSKIKAIDNTPITPRVINAYVMRPEKGPQYAFIFMQYCEGISFKNILHKKSDMIWANLQYSSVPIFESIKTQMKSILENLHSINIVHGDLLDNNVIIQFDQENTPVVKIIDFGQACPIELYTYFYAKRVRHNKRPDEATYRMIDLIDKAIEIIQNKLSVERKSYKLSVERKSSKKTIKSRTKKTIKSRTKKSATKKKLKK